ncbi:MAG TPA: SPOR domain-containing protein [Flavihumibacter sp.]|nr:SPOR domain-containing protein [Bacteroidota bacterium]HPZ88814.1 SPOR domain-containing protein [Flavihumibacter sp.]
MKTMLFFATLLISLAGYSQVDTNSVIVKKDARIDQLIAKQIEINEFTTREARSNVPGFRIQVVNTTDRTKAIQAKTKVYQNYPELSAYLLYQSPYFRLRVGNFLTRKEAEVYLKKLTKDFSQNIYIVNDTVETNPDKSLEQD